MVAYDSYFLTMTVKVDVTSQKIPERTNIRNSMKFSPKFILKWKTLIKPLKE